MNNILSRAINLLPGKGLLSGRGGSPNNGQLNAANKNGGKKGALAYQVDDSLSELDQIKQCVFSSLVMQRHVYIKRIVACAEQIGIEQTVSEILPLLPRLVQDKHVPVRTGVARMIGKLGLFLATHVNPGELDGKTFVEQNQPFPALEAILTFSSSSSSSVDVDVDVVVDTDAKQTDEETPSSTSSSAETKQSSVVKSAFSAQIEQHTSSSSSSSSSSATPLQDGSPSNEGKQSSLSSSPPVSRLGYDCCVRHVIPTLELLLADSSHEVRTAAMDALVDVAQVLSDKDIGKYVLTLVLKLVHNDAEEEQRILAFLLMDRLADTFGAENCRGFIAMELAAKADDERSYRPLKAMAVCFGSICRVVGGDFMEKKLLHHFQRLSKNLMWGIRKGCVESLVQICSVSSKEIKKNVLIPLLIGFHKDVTRWVRKRAYEELGPFLYELRDNPELISSQLIHSFAMIPTFTASDPAIDAEVCRGCAYSFPAVCLVLGPDRWSELSSCYTSLSENKEHPIRRTLAASIHEVAKLLGPRLAERDLLPIAQRFLNDVDEVKAMVIRNIGHLILAMPVYYSFSSLTLSSSSSPSSPQQQQQQPQQPARKVLLPYIQQSQRQTQNWRLRQHLSVQIETLCLGFDAKISGEAMLHCIFELLMDDVSAVRERAAAHIGYLLLRLSVFQVMSGYLDDAKDALKTARYQEQTALWESVCTNMAELAKSTTYNDRQLFVRITCGAVVLLDSSTFHTRFFQLFATLVNDTVTNVRVLLAEAVHLLSHVMRERARESTPNAKNQEELECTVLMKGELDALREQLGRDTVLDVRHRASLERSLLTTTPVGSILAHSWQVARDQMQRRSEILNRFEACAEADYREAATHHQRSRASSNVVGERVHQQDDTDAQGGEEEGNLVVDLLDIEALHISTDVPHIHTIDAKANRLQQLKHSSSSSSSSLLSESAFDLPLEGMPNGSPTYERVATPRNPYADDVIDAPLAASPPASTSETNSSSGEALLVDRKAVVRDEFELDPEEMAAIYGDEEGDDEDDMDEGVEDANDLDPVYSQQPRHEEEEERGVAEEQEEDDEIVEVQEEDVEQEEQLE